MDQNHNQINGYIYIRANEYWNMYNIYKLGKTTNIVDREYTYITSELNRGKYIKVIEIANNILSTVEKQLQIYFTSLNLHVYNDGGTEFFKQDIVNHIFIYLDNNNILYKLLTDDEINNLLSVERKENTDVEIKPRDYQISIIENSYNYFTNNDKGILILPCGYGKTYISLFISIKLNVRSIVIGVPNLLLLDQWYKTILSIMPNYNCLIVSANIKTEKIIEFLENNDFVIVITTYASSYKIFDATYKINYKFDMKILDEVHHLTSSNINSLYNIDLGRLFIQMLKIESSLQLSLTATIKVMENIDENTISNNNIKIFGNIVEQRSLLSAINDNIICDYVVQTIVMDHNIPQIINDYFKNFTYTEKLLFFSAYASLKSIYDNHSHHILIYTNNIDNADKVVKYINILMNSLFSNDYKIYYSSYNSSMYQLNQKYILQNFNENKYGIIVCVQCLGEGYDNSKIDGVVFAENMNSTIRIVQSALRAGRKSKEDVNKITKIILPILHKDEKNEYDLKKVREVVLQIGTDDETIEHKMRVNIVSMVKYDQNSKLEIINHKINDDILKDIKLKTVKRSELHVSYDKAIKIIADKNINCKEEYNELCAKDCRLSDDPEIEYKGKFKNWITYLSIVRKYYTIEQCKEKIAYYLNNNNYGHLYINLYQLCVELCKLDNMFPPASLWTDYYNVSDLDNIISVKFYKKAYII